MTGFGQLPALAAVFAQVSLVAVGGVITVIPEIQRQVVEVHGWMDARTFGTLFALAQAAPGPNMLVVTLIGWHVAGLQGAVVASLALITPPAIVSYALGSLWRRYRGAPLLADIQSGLNAVTIGLIAAAALLLAEGSSISIGAILVTIGTAAVLIFTKINPFWVLGAGALLGALGFV
jgi:chromate transporter